MAKERRRLMPSDSVFTRQLPLWIGRTIGLGLVGFLTFSGLKAGLAYGGGGLVILAGLAICGAIVGAIAQNYRRRSFLDWFLYGFLAFPVALIHVLVAGRSKAGLRKCPSCAEMVQAEAKVCRYCQRELPSPEPVSASVTSPGRFKTREEYERWKARQGR
jgi:hypothetical protein